MSTTSEITPPNRGTTAELRPAATDAAVTKWVRRKRGALRGRLTVPAIKSRSRRRAARVRDLSKLREDFGAYSSAGGSEEVAILLHLPPMLCDLVG